MELKYIESDIGKKKIKKYKRINAMYIICYILISIIYILMALDARKMIALIVFSILYILIILLLRFIKDGHLNRFMQETLTQEICIDGFINLNVYRAKRAEKKLKNHRYNKIYNYTLLNILDGYIRMGDFEQANSIIEFLEKRELDNLSKTFLIRNKGSMAFYKNDKEEFNKQYNNLIETANLLPEKQKILLKASLELPKNVLENNEAEVNKICAPLLNSKLLLNRVTASYYKGVILEKNNNEEYKKYYKFVVENGNNLYIAKTASKKLDMKIEVKYKGKKHIGFKILTTILFAIILFTTVFVCDFYIEAAKPKKWDTGIVNINNVEIHLPCTVEEIENDFNVQIDRSKIYDGEFYDLYLDGQYFQVDGSTFVVGDKCITLMIKGDMVEGIEVNIANLWNDELNTELGNMVIFPGNITANSTIEDIKETYKTGIINPAMRDWYEEIESYTDDGSVDKSYGINYSGDYFNISIDSLNGKVTSIFYYSK